METSRRILREWVLDCGLIHFRGCGSFVFTSNFIGKVFRSVLLDGLMNLNDHFAWSRRKIAEQKSEGGDVLCWLLLERQLSSLY